MKRTAGKAEPFRTSGGKAALATQIHNQTNLNRVRILVSESSHFQIAIHLFGFFRRLPN